jgi:hypothetical protein
VRPVPGKLSLAPPSYDEAVTDILKIKPEPPNNKPKTKRENKRNRL